MAKFKKGDRVKSSGMRDVYVVKRVMRAGDFSFDPNLKAEAEKAYAKGDVGYEVHDEDDSDEVTYLFEKDDHLTLANSDAPVSTNSVVRNAMAARTARNASDADVARYLAAAKDRIRAEVVALKDVAGLLKMEPVPPSAEKAYAKVVKAMASLQKAFAELS